MTKKVFLALLDLTLIVWYFVRFPEVAKMAFFSFVVILPIVGYGFSQIKKERKIVWYKYMDEKLAPALRIFMTLSLFTLGYFWSKGVGDISFEDPASGNFAALLLNLYPIAALFLSISYVARLYRALVSRD